MPNYEGPERRIHHVYVTRNTEYHVRAGLCVAVRDRRSGRWLEGHMAVRRRVVGSLTLHTYGAFPRSGDPTVGDAVYFATGERDLITSRIERVDRPVADVVKLYPR